MRPREGSPKNKDKTTFGTGSKDENPVNFAGKRAVPKLNDHQSRKL